MAGGNFQDRLCYFDVYIYVLKEIDIVNRQQSQEVCP